MFDSQVINYNFNQCRQLLNECNIMSTSEELVSVLRERFHQSEERVDFQKTFMNFARDQTCREAKMTVMSLRQVIGVYLEIRPNDSKYKLIPEVISLLGFTDRNMKVDCNQVIDHVFGRGTNQDPSDIRTSNGSDRFKRSSNGNKSNLSSTHRRDSVRSSNCSAASKNSSIGAASHEVKPNSASSTNRRGTFNREMSINSANSGLATKNKTSDIDDLERQYRMAVIDLQVAEYDNKLYRKTLEQLKKQLDGEKHKHEQLKTKFELRKRKFRNVKLKFRLHSEVLLREIVSMTNKCNEVCKIRAAVNEKEEIGAQKKDGKEQKDVKFKCKRDNGNDDEPGIGKGDSFVQPIKIPSFERPEDLSLDIVTLDTDKTCN